MAAAVAPLAAAARVNAQVATWGLAGNGNWNLASNWSPAAVPNSSTADVFIDGNASQNVIVSLNIHASVGTLAIDAGDQLFINASQRLSTFGTVTNNGLISVGATGTNTYFQPVGTITLAGSGILQLNNAGGASIYDNTNTNAASDHLINSATHTIQGLGNVGFTTNLQITNQGVIQANTAGGVLIVEANASGLTNTGTLRAINGGILTIDGDQDGLLDNASALIEAQNGSEVRFSNVLLTGGTLGTTGSGVLRTVTNTDNFFTDVTLTGSTVLGSRGDLGITGAIHNTGSIVMSAGTATADTYIDVQTAGATLSGGGTITMVDGTSITGLTAGGTLTIANQTIQGVGLIGRNSIAIVNQAGNTIRANVAGGTITIDPGAGHVTNTGTIEAINGGTLALTGNGDGSFLNSGGIIRAGDGSVVQLNSGVEIIGGTLDAVGSGFFRSSSSTNAIFDNLTIFGLVTTTSRGDITLRNTITNTGTIQINPGNATSDTLLEIDAAGATLAGGGAIFLNSNSGSRISGATGAPLTLANQTIRGGGGIGSGPITIDVQPAGIIDADTAGGVLVVDVISAANALTNTGLLQARNGGTLRFNDSFTNEGTVHAGASSLVDVNAVFTNGVNGTVRGAGTLEVSSIFTNNGRIAPGASQDGSTGTLTVNLGGTGLLAFGAGSTLDIDLGGAAATDRLIISGQAALAGQLAVRMHNGYGPGLSDSVTILTSNNSPVGSPLGLFANAAHGATILSADAKAYFTVNYFGNNEVRLSNFDLIGDFDNDGDLDATDIDALLRTTAATVPPAQAPFDVNFDGSVVTSPQSPASDSAHWVQHLKDTAFGDADLNGQVNFNDLLVLARNYGNADPALSWAVGNFDGINGVNFSDLLLLARNYGAGALMADGARLDFDADWALAQTLVPEPGAVAMILLAAVRRRRRVCDRTSA